MEMTAILDPKAVHNLASVTSKKRLLQIISEQANTVYGLNAFEVFNALQDREILGTTGVGKGVAIPHARLATVTSIVGLFTRLENPVGFDSLDKQPVDIIFTLLAPVGDNPEHLKALALVSRTLRNKDVCAKLRSNEEPQTLFSILTENAASKAA